MRKRKQSIGGWALGKTLGRGGNGIVYEVRRHDAIGALKILNSNERQRRARFRDEIDAMRKCADIPGVLRILDSSIPTDTKPWFVMDRAEVIRSRLGSNATTRETVQAIRDIATTLSLVHERQIAHRDVKPENLFFFEERWCVGDFGLAHFSGKAYVTQSGERIGPVHYIAPEMLNHAATADGRPADVFSLAKTLWVLVTGQTFPLPGSYIASEQSLRIANYVSSERTAALDALVTVATSFDPRERISMDDFASELSAWLRPIARTVAPIRIDIAEYASELERQKALSDARRIRSRELQAIRRENGVRIREELRPLADDVVRSLSETGLENVSLSIDNFEWGFEVHAHVPRAPDSGAQLRLYVGADSVDAQVKLNARFTVQSTGAHGGMAMMVWHKEVTFLAGGSAEQTMLHELSLAIAGQLQTAVSTTLGTAFADHGQAMAIVPGSVTVRTKDGPLEDATVVLFMHGGLYVLAKTNQRGQAAFSQTPATTDMAAFVSHPSYPGYVTSSSPLHGAVVLAHEDGISGSILATSGWTRVAGLSGALNFVYDAQGRRYVYAEGVAINSGQTQPVDIELGTALSFTDLDGRTVTAVPQAFHGACVLLNVRS